MNRRDFLSGLSYAGLALPSLGLPASGTPTAEGQPSGPEAVLLENEFFRVAFDLQAGRVSIVRAGGERLVTGAVARAITAEGTRSTTENAYRHELEERRFRDALGEGQEVLRRSRDGQGQLDLEQRIGLYAGQSAIVVELACRNVSSRAVILESLEPLSATGRDPGQLHWGGTRKLLTNGAMYYDPGVITDFAVPDPEVRRSWWNIALFRGYEAEGLVFGAVENRAAFGQIEVQRRSGDGIELAGQSVLAKGFVLEPGQTARSNRFMLTIGPNPYAALEQYAEAMGRLQGARTRSVVNGWCEWFYTFEHVTEEEVVRNAEFAARALKPYGLEYIQVDEGFQRWHGDWEGNARFPRGMKWLADRIRGLGLKPGIWLAPYVISEPTAVFQNHPEWLLRHADGRLKRVGPWPS